MGQALRVLIAALLASALPLAAGTAAAQEPPPVDFGNPPAPGGDGSGGGAPAFTPPIFLFDDWNNQQLVVSCPPELPHPISGTVGPLVVESLTVSPDEAVVTALAEGSLIRFDTRDSVVQRINLELPDVRAIVDTGDQILFNSGTELMAIDLSVLAVDRVEVFETEIVSMSLIGENLLAVVSDGARPQAIDLVTLELTPVGPLTVDPGQVATGPDGTIYIAMQDQIVVIPGDDSEPFGIPLPGVMGVAFAEGSLWGMGADGLVAFNPVSGDPIQTFPDLNTGGPFVPIPLADPFKALAESEVVILGADITAITTTTTTTTTTTSTTTTTTTEAPVVEEASPPPETSVAPPADTSSGSDDGGVPVGLIAGIAAVAVGVLGFTAIRIRKTPGSTELPPSDPQPSEQGPSVVPVSTFPGPCKGPCEEYLKAKQAAEAAKNAAAKAAADSKAADGAVDPAQKAADQAAKDLAAASKPPRVQGSASSGDRTYTGEDHANVEAESAAIDAMPISEGEKQERKAELRDPKKWEELRNKHAEAKAAAEAAAEKANTALADAKAAAEAAKEAAEKADQAAKDSEAEAERLRKECEKCLKTTALAEIASAGLDPETVDWLINTAGVGGPCDGETKTVSREAKFKIPDGKVQIQVTNIMANDRGAEGAKGLKATVNAVSDLLGHVEDAVIGPAVLVVDYMDFIADVSSAILTGGEGIKEKSKTGTHSNAGFSAHAVLPFKRVTATCTCTLTCKGGVWFCRGCEYAEAEETGKDTFDDPMIAGEPALQKFLANVAEKAQQLQANEAQRDQFKANCRCGGQK